MSRSFSTPVDSIRERDSNTEKVVSARLVTLIEQIVVDWSTGSDSEYVLRKFVIDRLEREGFPIGCAIGEDKMNDSTPHCCPGELEQLRRIDQAARKFVEASDRLGNDKTFRRAEMVNSAWRELNEALFDGRPSQPRICTFCGGNEISLQVTLDTPLTSVGRAKVRDGILWTCVNTGCPGLLEKEK